MQILLTKLHVFWFMVCDISLYSDWAYDFVDHFHYEREVVSVAINFFDRYVMNRFFAGNCLRVASSSDQYVESAKSEVQLLGMTCLYMAIKIHGCQDIRVEHQPVPKRKVKMQEFVDLTRDQFTMQDMILMEQAILSKLEWKMNPPTPLRFVSSFLCFLELSQDTSQDPHDDIQHRNQIKLSIYELARYLTEVSVCIHSLYFEKSYSYIALAAILSAMDAVQDIQVTKEGRESFLQAVRNATSTPFDLETIFEVESIMKRLCMHTIPFSNGLSTSIHVPNSPNTTRDRVHPIRKDTYCFKSSPISTQVNNRKEFHGTDRILSTSYHS